MEQAERYQLATSFQEMHMELQAIRERLETIKRNYPGFLRDQLFLSLSIDVAASEGNASALAHYINVGTDERWDEA